MRMNAQRPFWFDQESEEAGFSTAGMAIALLVTLSLVFTGAQVYQVQSTAAEIQEIADTAALAADNVVAEYYLVARVCDAVVLSLSLTGLVTLGMGVAALCTPLSAKAGTTLIDIGTKVLKARDSFARKAAQGLDKLQKAVPFLAAAAAFRATQANGPGYVGFAIAVPFEGEQVSIGDTGGADSLIDAVDDAADTLQKAGEEAENKAREAKAAKERAYEADCGAQPGYCMYERAAVLSDLGGGQNPYFSSVDTWGFSVALARAQAYYPRRLALESPQGESIDEQANSALRKRFYAYAAEEVGKGYVRETDDSFDAEFPLLPKNTAEMRATRLFTEAVYPVTVNDEGLFEMHAWPGCPRAAGASGSGSLAQREAGDYAVCPVCQFTASSLGSVAAASSSIANGFEYHYRIVAQEAEAYEEARQSFNPKARKVKNLAQSLFGQVVSSLKSMASQRISVSPPGRFGVVAIVASTEPVPASRGFASNFVGDAGALGTRVAISGATLVSDSPEQGRTIIASALDGVRERSDSPLIGVLDGVLDVWSAVLFAYSDGQSRIGEGIDAIDSRLSFGSESRLGLWSSKEFEELMESVGLQPVELDAPKPVLVNTAHVLGADSSAFSVRLLGVKRVASGLSGNNLLEGVVNGVEDRVLQEIDEYDGEVTIAEIEIAGPGSPAIPITVSLPDSARSGASDLVSSAVEWLRGIVGDITGTRQWR